MKKTKLSSKLTEAIAYSFKPAIEIWESIEFISNSRTKNETIEDSLNCTLILQCST